MLKYKDKILKSISIFLIFLLGLLTERFQIDNKIEIFLKVIMTKRSLYLWIIQKKKLKF